MPISHDKVIIKEKIEMLVLLLLVLLVVLV